MFLVRNSSWTFSISQFTNHEGHNCRYFGYFWKIIEKIIFLNFKILRKNYGIYFLSQIVKQANMEMSFTFGLQGALQNVSQFNSTKLVLPSTMTTTIMVTKSCMESSLRDLPLDPISILVSLQYVFPHQVSILSFGSLKKQHSCCKQCGCHKYFLQSWKPANFSRTQLR